MIVIGQAISDFTAESTSGVFNLADQRGQIVVMYFYPKDNTPGCTAESADFRDAHAAFTEAGALVVGISRDSLKSHANFRAKLELPFHLIADTNEALCTQFNVIKNKVMYGKPVRGIERSTFVIDQVGVLRHEVRGVKVSGHVQEVLNFVRQIRH